jgi:hypothetical protein
MRLVWGSVEEIVSERPGVQRLAVTPDEGAGAEALCFPALSGWCAAGDRVLLNTTAVDLGLGTGGAHFVIARIAAGAEPMGVAFQDDSGGHIMKLRYTPLQRDVLSVESQESPLAPSVAEIGDVDGMPVVCCGLHSQVPLAAAAIKSRLPEARIAYCMTDEASLPLALSDLVADSVRAGLIDATITCGQAFGGEIEAVTLHSGLVAARVVAQADVAIVAIGPGVVGTASVLGHGGVAQGESINAAASVGGRPVAVLRMSFADARERHRGVSHHSLAALGRIALAPATVPVPMLQAAQSVAIDAQLEDGRVWERHLRVDVDAVLPDVRGVALLSMGRTPEDDPAFFAAAAAAGYAAADLIE